MLVECPAFSLWKTQHLWSTIKQSAIKWGMPILVFPLGEIGIDQEHICQSLSTLAKRFPTLAQPWSHMGGLSHRQGIRLFLSEAYSWFLVPYSFTLYIRLHPGPQPYATPKNLTSLDIRQLGWDAKMESRVAAPPSFSQEPKSMPCWWESQQWLLDSSVSQTHTGEEIGLSPGATDAWRELPQCQRHTVISIAHWMSLFSQIFKIASVLFQGPFWRQTGPHNYSSFVPEVIATVQLFSLFRI